MHRAADNLKGIFRSIVGDVSQRNQLAHRTWVIGGVAGNVGCGTRGARHEFVAKLCAVVGANVEFANVCVMNVHVKTRPVQSSHSEIARRVRQNTVHPERRLLYRNRVFQASGQVRVETQPSAGNGVDDAHNALRDDRVTIANERPALCGSEVSEFRGVHAPRVSIARDVASKSAQSVEERSASDVCRLGEDSQPGALSRNVLIDCRRTNAISCCLGGIPLSLESGDLGFDLPGKTLGTSLLLGI